MSQSTRCGISKATCRSKRLGETKWHRTWPERSISTEWLRGMGPRDSA